MSRFRQMVEPGCCWDEWQGIKPASDNPESECRGRDDSSLCAPSLLSQCESWAHSLTSWAHSLELTEAPPSLHLGSVGKGGLPERQNHRPRSRERMDSGKGCVGGISSPQAVGASQALPIQCVCVCVYRKSIYISTCVYIHKYIYYIYMLSLYILCVFI